MKLKNLARKKKHYLDLKSEILKIAIESVACGIDSELSFRKIAKQLGVQHNSVVHHFKSKENLLFAIATEGFINFSQILKEAVLKPKSRKAQLVAMGTAYLNFALKNPGYFRAMFGPHLSQLKSSDPELLTASNLAYAALNQACRHVVTEALPKASDLKINKLTQNMVLQNWSLVHGMAMLFIDGPVGYHFQHSHRIYKNICANILKNSVKELYSSLAC